MHFRHPVSEWRRLIGRLRSQVIFCKRATNYRALLQKMTYKDKASYYSSPSCIRVVFIIFAYAYESLITHPLMRYPNLSLICPSKVIGMIFAYAYESRIAHSLIRTHIPHRPLTHSYAHRPLTHSSPASPTHSFVRTLRTHMNPASPTHSFSRQMHHHAPSNIVMLCVGVFVCVWVCVCPRVCVHVCVSVSVSVSVSVCMCCALT